MDDAGNILIRRYAKSNVYVKSTASSPNEETSIGAEILKLPNQALESEKIVKVSGTNAAAIYRDRPYPTSIPNANKRSIVLHP